VAVHYGASDKMLGLLLEHGAKANQKDKQGRTPLGRAREKKHKKAIAYREGAKPPRRPS
jgi:ankyrin repeat protein